jgi:hypothetical protein
VFDGATATTHPGWVVLVRGEKTAAPVAAGEVTVPKGAKVIDLRGATLLPRLIKVRLGPSRKLEPVSSRIREPLDLCSRGTYGRRARRRCSARS